MSICHLELIRVKSSENVYEGEKEFLESIIRAINVMETARKHSEEEERAAYEAAHAMSHAVSEDGIAKTNNDDDDDNDEEE